MNESCGSCGGDIGRSSSFPWHYGNEDCRAIRDPIEEGDCHPDCGPIVVRNTDGQHCHENDDGRCWHEDEDREEVARVLGVKERHRK